MSDLPRKPWLYLITDRRACEPRELLDLIEESARAGIDLIQIREKDLSARSLARLVERAVQIVKPYGTRVLVNDRFDIALACGAQGVHLTARSLPPGSVRERVGDRLIIGVSTHSAAEVGQAAEGGADFVVCGPVFDTPSKRPYGQPLGLDAFAAIVKEATIPVVGLGGIDAANYRSVLDCDASGIAAIRLFIESPSLQAIVRQVKEHGPRIDANEREGRNS
jgi:thiamine-phosphate pyrophosphorylase